MSLVNRSGMWYLFGSWLVPQFWFESCGISKEARLPALEMDFKYLQDLAGPPDDSAVIQQKKTKGQNMQLPRCLLCACVYISVGHLLLQWHKGSHEFVCDLHTVSGRVVG